MGPGHVLVTIRRAGRTDSHAHAGRFLLCEASEDHANQRGKLWHRISEIRTAKISDESEHKPQTNQSTTCDPRHVAHRAASGQPRTHQPDTASQPLRPKQSGTPTPSAPHPPDQDAPNRPHRPEFTAPPGSLTHPPTSTQARTTRAGARAAGLAPGRGLGLEPERRLGLEPEQGLGLEAGRGLRQLGLKLGQGPTPAGARAGPGGARARADSGPAKGSGSPPLLGEPPRPRTHRPDVAHSRIFPIRASNCPADAWATAGPPHTRRSSLWICPCVCPVRWCHAATIVLSSLRIAVI